MPRILVRTGLVVALVAAPLWARAEPPSGSYAIDHPAAPAIVVPAESQEPLCESTEGFTFCISGDLSTDGSGSVSGDGLLEFTGEIEGVLAGAFSGKVIGAAGEPRLSLTMEFAGELWYQGEPFEAESTLRAKCVRDEQAGGFVCSGQQKVCLSYLGRRLGCESAQGFFVVEEQSGGWTLALELATDERGNVSGSATVELASGGVLQYAVSGRYDARRDSSSLRLAELGTARGSKLRLGSVVLTGGTATAGSLDYQIAGQKGRATLPLPGPVVFVRSSCARGAFCDTAADTANFFSGARNPDPFQDEAIIIYGFSSYP